MTGLGRLGPGALLDGRYSLVEPAGAGPGWARWLAEDSVLGRRVVVLCFAVDGKSAVDAARRAAGVDEPRLVRVLDAGVGEALNFVVEEPLEGACSLTQVLATRTLPAEETRRIVGEIAGALDVAGHRGLHHLALRPDAVWLLGDGTVKVRGLATEAALSGRDETTPDPARADAQGLLRLVYAALTGRWPTAAAGPAQDPTSGGLPPAPLLEDGRPAPPSTLASAVPAEFDAMVLGLDSPSGLGAGPASPAAVVQVLRPWATVPLLDYTPTHAPTHAPAHAPAPGMGSGVEAPQPVLDPTNPPAQSGAPSGAAPSSASSSDASPPERTSGGSAPDAASRVPTPAPVPPTEVLSLGSGRVETEARLSEVLEETDTPPEQPAPLPERLMAGQQRPDPRLALGIVAALVVFLGVLGVWGLPRLGGLDLGSSPVKRPTTATAGTPAATKTGAAGSPGATLAAVAILQGASLEPGGDGQVASRSAAAAWDGNPATLWRSNKWYASESFGGLSRAGYGLVADLGQITPVARVTVTLPVAQDIAVYVSNQANITSATKLGESAGKTGELVFDAPGGAPLSGQLVIVMVTKLGPDGAGKYRAMVSELEVAK